MIEPNEVVCFRLLFLYVRKYCISPIFAWQVSLLNQEVIIEKIQSEVELQLINSNETRTFKEQVSVL